MNNLQVFKNTEFGELKVLVIDGKEYFPATDCARMLGYSNPYVMQYIRSLQVPRQNGSVKHRGP
jgi:prophage antirepressor-like protein